MINESVLNLDEDHFLDRESITIIRNLKVDLNFSFEEINCEYVTRLLSTIDEKKSSGPDEIPSDFLKISTPAIAAPLTNLFNHCIATSTWPKEWKRSNITPVYKKEEAANKKNYRSINVLSVIPKVFEKIKFDQLYHALSLIFSSNMSGFLRATRAVRLY